MSDKNKLIARIDENIKILEENLRDKYTKTGEHVFADKEMRAEMTSEVTFLTEIKETVEQYEILILLKKISGIAEQLNAAGITSNGTQLLLDAMICKPDNDLVEKILEIIVTEMETPNSDDEMYVRIKAEITKLLQERK